MTKEQIKAIRDGIGKDKPLTIVYDNDKIVYDNVKDQFPIIWDDESELFYQIGVNNDYYAQVKIPYNISVYTYECTQDILVGVSVADCINFIKDKGSSLTEQQKKKCENLLSCLGVNNITIPATAPKE